MHVIPTLFTESTVFAFVYLSIDWLGSTFRTPGTANLSVSASHSDSHKQQ
jgi:hypothetical protein